MLGLGPLSAQALGGRQGRPPTPGLQGFAFTGGWSADYAGGGWTGTLSLGESGGRPLVGTFPPASGTPINGYTPANFGGLVNTDTIGELGQYISGAASWSFVMVLKPTTIVADAGARTNEPALWSAYSGYNGVAISDVDAHVPLSTRTSIAVPVHLAWTTHVVPAVAPDASAS